MVWLYTYWTITNYKFGALAQLGERLICIQEVNSSTLLCSTKLNYELFIKTLLNIEVSYLFVVSTRVKNTKRKETLVQLYAITQEDSKFKTLKGQTLKPIQFPSISKAREFKRSYNTDNSPLYGMDRYQYQYIANEYPEDMVFDKDAIKIFTVDIECTAENGFPDVENPTEELLAITVKKSI